MGRGTIGFVRQVHFRSFVVVFIVAVCAPAPGGQAVGGGGDANLVDAEQALARGELGEALRLAGRHVSASPGDARGHYLLGVIHDQKGEWGRSLSAYDKAIGLDPKRVTAYHRRGVAHFMLGDAERAVADFDKYLEGRPDERAGHWQRGIALYYAGRFEEGAKQFELHRTVNPDDVENSAWHFLCVAKWKGVEAARKELIDVQGDPRMPMMKVQEMLAGKATPADVIVEAKGGEPAPTELRVRLFYAHLYLGLYYEALGDVVKAKEHVELSAGEFHVSGYMGGVAKVHAKIRGRKP